VTVPHQEHGPAAAAFISLQDKGEGQVGFLVLVMADLKVVYRFIADGFRVTVSGWGAVNFLKRWVFAYLPSKPNRYV
jgi:hypothetical protein